MANLFEETVVDFDLNFLQPPKHDVTNIKIEKQRQSIVNIKNKIIKSHCLVQKYYLQKDRLEETESLLLASKEECKQACLDYKVTLEKCLQLEKDAFKLKDINRELEQKMTHLDNQCEAMKSHAYQLQSLVKEHESVIQALTIEKQLDKHTITESEKKLHMLEKERDAYLKDINWMRDVILGKRKSKCCKNILNKYKDLKSSDKSESENSDNESYFGDSPLGSPINDVLSKTETTNNIIIAKESHDNDSDCCHEDVVSEDTGRGSSLAFSDAEKIVNSPDTGFGVTNIHHRIINKEIIIHVDVATSPIRIEENLTSNLLTSASEQLPSGNIATESPEYFITDFPLSTEVVTIKEKKQLLNASTSPIPQTDHMKDISTSPIVFAVPCEIQSKSLDCLCENSSSKEENLRTEDSDVTPCHLNTDYLSRGNEIVISTDSIDYSENICTVEIDKSAVDDTSNDLEVERILSDMRLRHRLISPIPKTPKNLHKHKIPSQDINSNNPIGCPDALKIKEENKALHANINFLCKEIMLIKNMLNIKMPSNLETVQISNSGNIDENSPETIIIANNELNVCGSDGTYLYHNTNENIIETSALSKLVDDGPIHIENIDDQPLEQHSLTTYVNSDCEISDSTDIVKNNTTKHAEERENETQISINDLCFDHKQISTSDNLSNLKYGKEKSIQYKEQTGPNVEINHCKNRNDEMYITNGDEEDNSNDAYFTENSNPHSNDEVNIPHINEEEIIHHTDESDNLDDNHDTQRDYGQLLSYERTYDDCSIITKPKKLTKLDKFKKKMLPKSKISRLNAPSIRKLKKKTRVVPISNIVLRNKPLQILNNKDAYDKALKVMSEFKSKGSDEQNKTFRRPNAKLSKSPQRKNEKSSKNSKDLLRIENTTKSSSDCENEVVEHKSSEIKDISSHELNETKSKKIVTRSKYNNLEQSQIDNNNKSEYNTPTESKSPKNTRRRKRIDSNESNVSCKRMLRSSYVEKLEKEKPGLKRKDEYTEKNVTDYSDLDVFAENMNSIAENENVVSESILEKTDNQLNNNKQNHIDPIDNVNDNQKYVRRSKRLCSNASNASRNSLKFKSEAVNNVTLECDYKQHNGRIEHSQGKSSINVETNKGVPINENVPQNSVSTPHKFEDTTDLPLNSESTNNFGNSILCKMIVKYGKKVVRYHASKVSDNIINNICKMIETSIDNIIELSTAPSGNQIQVAINELVENMKTYNKKSLLAALMKYLQDPARKIELYNKVNCHPSLAMTKKEQIILSALQKLNTTDNKIVNDLLCNIEYTLFRLNKTPEFDTIESLSHFYAVTCKLFHMKYRLKTFLLDGMYCLQFKAVIIIMQCLTTWMHVLPLAHTKYAKTPLITCIVYLMHFYKCEDKLNRIQNIRWILSKKFSYSISEWNESKILEMFVNAIKFVKDDPVESNMLRLALLIFGKRHGPKWCQRNVINNMLLPMIEDEKTPEKVKIFCIKVLGPLLKPYPGDMKVHCEIIVNQLLDMFEQDNITHGIKEAIIISLIYMSKHNPMRVIKALLSWQPESISSDLENLLKAHVREKPIKVWKTILSKT